MSEALVGHFRHVESLSFRAYFVEDVGCLEKEKLLAFVYSLTDRFCANVI